MGDAASAVGNWVGGAAGDIGKFFSTKSQNKVNPADVTGQAQAQVDPFQQQNAAYRDALAKQLTAVQNRGTAIGTSLNAAAPIGPAAQASAAQMGNAVQANAARVGPAILARGSQIDQGAAAAQQQAQQGQLADMQMAAAQGRGPSLATGTIEQGIGQSIAAQNAMANSARGGTAGSNRRLAAMNAAQIQAQGAAAAGQQRIQEQQAAQAALGQTLATGRAQNIGLATEQAQMAQQAQQYNAAAQNAALLQNAQMAQQTGLANQAAANERLAQNANFAQQAGLANMGAMNQQNMYTQGLQAQIAQGNTAAYLTQQAQNDAQTRALLGAQIGTTQQDFENLQNAQKFYGGIAGFNVGQDTAKEGKIWDATMGLLNSAGGATASMAMSPAGAMSDEREKRNIRSGDKQVEKMLDSIGAHIYEYKHPGVAGEDDREHVSPMAQELEKSELGRGMVEQGPDGLKRVDYQRGLGVILAAQANLNDRLRKVEGKGR